MLTYHLPLRVTFRCEAVPTGETPLCGSERERCFQVINKVSLTYQKSVDRGDMLDFLALSYTEQHHNNSLHVTRWKRETLLQNFPNWTPNWTSLASGKAEKGLSAA